jgi:mannose-6-phosphate isomerase-like protein (cupin superfamily)
MNNKTDYASVEPYITRDGSTIRELLHPDLHGNSAQSLAEARIAAGNSTLLHRHHQSEEIYHVTGGEGVMFLGDKRFPIKVGDSACIPPGTPHRVKNTGTDELVILCCCAPPYRHEDTELLEG